MLVPAHIVNMMRRWIKDYVPLPGKYINRILEMIPTSLYTWKRSRKIPEKELEIFKKIVNNIIKEEVESKNYRGGEIRVENILIRSLDIKMDVVIYPREEPYFVITEEVPYYSNSNSPKEYQRSLTEKLRRRKVFFFDPEVEILTPDFPYYSFFERIDLILHDLTLDDKVVYSFNNFKKVKLKIKFKNKIIVKDFEALDMSSPSSYNPDLIMSEDLTIGNETINYAYIHFFLDKILFYLQCSVNGKNKRIDNIISAKLLATEDYENPKIMNHYKEFLHKENREVVCSNYKIEIHIKNPYSLEIPVLLKYYDSHKSELYNNTYLSKIEIGSGESIYLEYLSEASKRHPSFKLLMKILGTSPDMYHYHVVVEEKEDMLIPFDESMPKLSNEDLNKYSYLPRVVMVANHTPHNIQWIYLFNRDFVITLVKQTLGLD